METRYVQTKDPAYRKMTKFGNIFLLSFAVGVGYWFDSRIPVRDELVGLHGYGDIFGAPLAFEALMAFFVESTFIGLWMFAGPVRACTSSSSGWSSLGRTVSALWM